MFGGNASQVTISGESAGGGSVMLQDMAYGGSLGSSLFVNVSSWTLGECSTLISQRTDYCSVALSSYAGTYRSRPNHSIA
jgi:hypothetical protein